jgi:hypothetical protein
VAKRALPCELLCRAQCVRPPFGSRKIYRNYLVLDQNLGDCSDKLCQNSHSDEARRNSCSNEVRRTSSLGCWSEVPLLQKWVSSRSRANHFAGLIVSDLPLAAEDLLELPSVRPEQRRLFQRSLSEQTTLYNLVLGRVGSNVNPSYNLDWILSLTMRNLVLNMIPSFFYPCWRHTYRPGQVHHFIL